MNKIKASFYRFIFLLKAAARYSLGKSAIWRENVFDNFPLL